MGGSPNNPRAMSKSRITPWKTCIKKETYRSLQAVKILHREAFVVWLKPLVRTKGDPSTVPENYLIMAKKRKTIWKAFFNGKKVLFPYNN